MLTHVDRLATVCITDPLLTAGLLRSSFGIPILMYHSVSVDPEPGVSPYFRLATSPGRFRAQMQWLREEGYSVIDLGEALERLQAGGDINRRFVVITFDDGFRDFAEHAWPVLAEFGYRATMFLPTAFIGQDRTAFKSRPCLTWREVRDLRSCGVSFGAHTVTHPVLHDLPWPRVISEIRDSRACIEDELTETVTTFAYPFAFPREDRRFVIKLREGLVELGFTAAVTTTIGRATPGHDPLCLRRLPINECDDRRLFVAKLSGAYDWVGIVQQGVRFRSRFRTLRIRSQSSA